MNSNLSDHHFFKRFSPDLRKAMLEVGKVVEYRKGALVFSIGDADTDFYMLVEGRIHIHKVSKGGQKRILRTVQPGDTFALVSLFDDKPMFVAAECVGPARVFTISKEDFTALMQQYYELARFIVDGLVRRIRKYGEAMTSMTVYFVDQRFISYLFDLSALVESDEVQLPDTLSTIAEQIGTAREVLSREVSKMVKKGWIAKKGQKVVLKKRGEMQKRLEER
ncbi:MAG: Crp/Fnr family transcriptional regulator [bacterium]|nr:Crp/Fnr family transcriptional regulator [bacterium]